MIALNRLGMGFDVQGGGSDLIFPHHEHSAAHAEALTGEHPFARHYVHAGMIGLDGEKMSKSRGNLVLVSKLRGAGVDPMAIRLALLDGHYRADREWTGGRLPAAEARLARWRAAAAGPAGPPAPTGAGRRCASGWPTTSTPSARSPRSTAGRSAAADRRRRRRGARHWSRDARRRAARRRALACAAADEARQRGPDAGRAAGVAPPPAVAPAQVALELAGDRVAGRLAQLARRSRRRALRGCGCTR